MSDEVKYTIEDQPKEDVTEKALKKANVTQAVIDELARLSKGVKIEGLDDKAGWEALRAVRLKCREVRIVAEKVCKSGREEAVAIQKKWIGVEKDVTGRISAIEDPLKESEDKWVADREERVQEKIRAEQARVDGLMAQLRAYGSDANPLQVERMTPEEFSEALEIAKKNFEILEAHRLAEEQAKRDEEARVAKQAEENRIAQAKLDAEREAFEAEKRAHQARVEAEENARIEADRKKAREQQESEEKSRREATEAEEKRQAEERKKLAEEKRKIDEERARLEAEESRKREEAQKEKLRLEELSKAPDKEKILAWMDSVMHDAKVEIKIESPELALEFSEARSAIIDFIENERRAYL